MTDDFLLTMPAFPDLPASRPSSLLGPEQLLQLDPEVEVEILILRELERMRRLLVDPEWPRLDPIIRWIPAGTLPFASSIPQPTLPQIVPQLPPSRPLPLPESEWGPPRTAALGLVLEAIWKTELVQDLVTRIMSDALERLKRAFNGSFRNQVLLSSAAFVTLSAVDIALTMSRPLRSTVIHLLGGREISIPGVPEFSITFERRGLYLGAFGFTAGGEVREATETSPPERILRITFDLNKFRSSRRHWRLRQQER